MLLDELNNLKFSVAETLQFLGLLPCVFLSVYILVATKVKNLALVPFLYFIFIAAGLIYELLPQNMLRLPEYRSVAFMLLLADSMIASISFLFIVQMLNGRLPPLIYWGVLLFPLIATTPFIYAFLNDESSCLSDIDICFPSKYALHLNVAVVSLFVFLLLMFVFSRSYWSQILKADYKNSKYKYWLVVCLVVYNLILITIDISVVTEATNEHRYAIVKALVKIAFIYMVFTSIFRVFTESFAVKPISTQKDLTEYEKSLAIRAERVLSQEMPYQESGFNRASFAKMLGVREHILSRVINLYFKQSFSELANAYRITRSKELLLTTEKSITDISYEVGFSSITSFNRVFKEVTNLSPSEFRDQSGKPV